MPKAEYDPIKATIDSEERIAQIQANAKIETSNNRVFAICVAIVCLAFSTCVYSEKKADIEKLRIERQCPAPAVAP
jgi:hypothetical protein